ncbi:hypothetical protein KL86DPRO_30059 [uncultured delta proteobacterium]|uniref:Uncharacterized protein n=1 Tax=uncultured delta proteobacterium TaxID=34034 RepID=A0A212K765_9DELT|nr:hypothetical protein KL86DPRO_30059 [uncultured delta proteobacterium]
MSQKKEMNLEEKADQTAAFKAYIDDKIAKARVALAELDSYTQRQVDALAHACAKTIFDNAEEFARDAVAETKLGTVEYKTLKNKNKARINAVRLSCQG